MVSRLRRDIYYQNGGDTCGSISEKTNVSQLEYNYLYLLCEKKIINDFLTSASPINTHSGGIVEFIINRN
jgi:hypothetical protein